MSSSFDRLRAEIEQIPELSRDQELALSALARAGDEEAKRGLISATLRVALPIALSLSRSGHARWEAGDLLGEAVKAMNGLVDRWDGRGTFAGYAKMRIRGAMKDFLRRKADLIRSNGNDVEVFSVDVSGEEGEETWKDRLEATTPDDSDAAPDIPPLTDQERRVMEATVFRSPRPGTVEEASRALKLRPATIRQVLRTALAKRAA